MLILMFGHSPVTGVTINGSGTSVTLDFATNATSGILSVKGHNTCGDGNYR